jgi:hypothetical protein
MTVFCEFVWPGADGLRIFTFPDLVNKIKYCKETAQTRKGRAIQSASTKSQMTNPEPGISTSINTIICNYFIESAF